MINKISYNQLGGADHGWLQAKHHFSFANYHDPKRIHFGPMRVINDDVIAPHKGFAPHAHDNMEIITYVRKGAITHTDDMGNKGRTAAGDIQVMSAGSGVVHSEFNLENEETNLYQIWIFPNKKNVQPRWEAKQFPKDPVQDQLKPLVTGFNHPDQDSLKIYQDAIIYAGRMNKGSSISQTINHQAYALCSYGSFAIEDVELSKGDGAEITNKQEVLITAKENCEILLIDLPKF